jgi:hypothetical protein
MVTSASKTNYNGRTSLLKAVSKKLTLHITLSPTDKALELSVNEPICKT